jgi:hypothetical protein
VANRGESMDTGQMAAKEEKTWLYQDTCSSSRHNKDEKDFGHESGKRE